MRALHAVTKEGMSLRKAAATFGVPKTTLADKIGEPLERPLPKKTTRRKRFSWVRPRPMIPRAPAAVPRRALARDGRSLTFSCPPP